jgi:ATP-dependent Clp protease ATP-binding subunit ClpC
MYERFTHRARKVMQLANQEAQRFNHEHIGTAHILLGLVKEGAGVAASVLNNLDFDLRKIRLEVEKLIQPDPSGEQAVMGRLPHTASARKVIVSSVEEARSLNHNYVGTEHLLLGLLKQQEGVATQVFLSMRLKLETVRYEVLYTLGQIEPPRIASALRFGRWLRRLFTPSKKKNTLEQRAAMLEAKVAKLAAKLRELGIDPDSV